MAKEPNVYRILSKEDILNSPFTSNRKPKKTSKSATKRLGLSRESRRAYDALGYKKKFGNTNRGVFEFNRQFKQAAKYTKYSPEEVMASAKYAKFGKAGYGLSRAAKVAGRLSPGGLAASAVYEGARAISKGVRRAKGPGGKAFHGQFVDYTSKPTNRGKRGVNY